MSRQIFKDILAEDEKRDNLQERENKKSSGNNLKTPIQHSDRLEIQNICDQEQKNPFKAFDNGIRLFINTGNLVETLWKTILKEPYADHKVLKIVPDWKTKVQTWYANSVQTGSECIGDVISGQIFDEICEWRIAIDRHERLIAYAREHAYDRLEEIALGNMGLAYLDLGEYHKAIEFHELSLEIARHIGDAQGEGNALNDMGLAYSELGEHRKAIEFHELSLDIARRIGDVQGEGNAQGSIGNAYLQLGDYSKAIGLYEQHLVVLYRPKT